MKQFTTMPYIHTAFVLAVALVTTPASAQSNPEPRPATVAASASLPTDEEIRAILADRVDVLHKHVGMVVGIITPQGRRIISYGKLNQEDPRPLNGDTVFEIGSVTKIFTALLLADAVQRGDVSLNDPLAKFMPPGVKVPERNGKKITLVDLATQTSGLPFMPPDFPLFDPAGYPKYTEQQIFQFLSTYELPQDIGSKWTYSNLGFGLLGKALARRAGMDYDALVRARISGPLGMKSTSVIVTPDMQARLAAGHDAKLNPAPVWNVPSISGEGELRSSANDVLTFLGAFIGYSNSPLAPAMTAMLETRRPGPNFQQALGWWVLPLGPNDGGIVTHGGVTFGHTCTAAYDPKTRIGVVVLSNSAESDGGLAWHLLRPTFPVETSASIKAIKERKEIAVDPKVFDSYVGNYQHQPPAPGEPYTIERQGDMLVITFGSEPEGHRLYAESDKKFFLKGIDLTLTFQTDSSGRATGVAVNFGRTESLAPRMDATPDKK